MLSVKCEKCGTYTKDVYDFGDKIVIDPKSPCEKCGGVFVEYKDNQIIGTGAVHMSHYTKEQVDLGGVSPLLP